MRHRVRRVHFVGVGGVGMSGLAEILVASGYQVSGSDLRSGPSVERLASLGVHVTIGHDESAVAEADVVVYSSAIPASNPELRRAEAQNVLGACLSALGRFDEAEPLLVEGYSGLKKTRGDRHLITQYALRYLIAHYERRGLPEQAAAYRRGTSGN